MALVSHHTQFTSAFGELSLFRYSRSRTRTEANLQAWDAADSLLLDHLSKHPSLGRVLVLNDSNGALVCALAQSGRAGSIISAGDSWVAQRAAQDNLARNGLEGVTFYSSLAKPEEPVDTLLVKLPKSLRLLADQLCRYRALLGEQTQVVFAGMVKHMSAGHFSTIESLLGPTTTSLAEKKARLIFAPVEVAPSPIPDPVSYVYQTQPVHALANVFSGESLDIGARCLLQHFPSHRVGPRVADLGCGNGILGLWAAKCFPDAQVDFFDESMMAVASAEQNAALWGVSDRCRYVCGDGMALADDERYDLILCNPPFHQQQVVGDFIARQMFHDARRCLRAGGELWIVANRHMNYHQSLKRLFGNCTTQSDDKKFVVLTSVKS